MKFVVLAFAALFGLTACGGSDVTALKGPAGIHPADVSIYHTGSSFPNYVAVGGTIRVGVQVLRSGVVGSSAYVRGAPVTWSAEGGTIAGESNATDSLGTNAAQWKPTRAGLATATATIHLDGGDRTFILRFTAVDTSDVHVEKVAGDSQVTAGLGVPLSAPLRVRVVDAHNAGVAAATVHWKLRHGSGTLSPTNITDDDGVASATWTLGSSLDTVDAYVGSPFGSARATFTALPYAGVRLQKVSGDVQSAIDDTPLAAPLVLRAVDANNAPLAGIPIHWTTSGNVLSNVDSVTDAGGVARAAVTVGCGDAVNASVLPTFAQTSITFSIARLAGPTIRILHPDSVFLEVGDTTTFSAAAFDRCGLGGRPTSVASGNPAAVSVSSTSPAFGFARANATARTFVNAREGATTATIPFIIGSPLTRVRSASIVATRGCALDDIGDAYCWSSLANPLAKRVAPGFGFVSVTVDAHDTCALDATGRAYCWGDNDRGQIGDGTNAAKTQPVAIGGALRFIAISSSTGHTCAIAMDGGMYCWGTNASGELGDGTVTTRFEPTRVATKVLFRAVGTSAGYTCGLGRDGTPYCWGTDPAVGVRLVPAPVDNSPPLVALTLGFQYRCGLSASGSAYCWGDNSNGQLGTGSVSTTRPMPVMGGLSFVSIGAGLNHVCGSTGDGSVYCWGSSTAGARGITTISGPGPTRVDDPAVTGTVVTGPDARWTCVVNNGSVHCWGDGGNGWGLGNPSRMADCGDTKLGPFGPCRREARAVLRDPEE